MANMLIHLTFCINTAYQHVNSELNAAILIQINLRENAVLKGNTQKVLV